MRFDLDLSQEVVDGVKELAQELGVTEDELIREIINQFLMNSNRITRFVSKLGPKKFTGGGNGK